MVRFFLQPLSVRQMRLLCASLLAGFVLCGALQGLYWGRTQLDAGAALCADTLRLHIRAASDAVADQSAKLRVRDAVLAVMQQCPAQSAPEARAWAAGRLLQRICDDFRLSCGRITDTGYVIPQRIESNKTLFDIMQNALDLTMMNTRQVYVLYDDYGKICLQNIADRKMNLILDAETGENYEYSTSIDGDTYNQVKLTYDNKDTGKREIYMTKDSSHINEWGVLQYYDTLNDGENGASKAEALLKYYNKVSRNFQVKDAFGDVRIRAGTYPLVMFSVSNYWLHNFMMVEKATHTFNEEEHTMTLTLSGGEFTE